jgi:hypothetical protein
MNPHYPQVAFRAGHRCEYCHAPEAVFNLSLEVDRLDRKAAHWVGRQMIRWGKELQRYSIDPEADEAA